MRLNSELEKLFVEYTELTLTFPAGKLYNDDDAVGTVTSGKTFLLVEDETIGCANVGRGTEGRVCFGCPRIGNAPLCKSRDVGAGLRGIF